MEDYLEIADKRFSSRLIVGTGKYRTAEDMVQAVDASGTEMVTVAIRRLDLDNPNSQGGSACFAGSSTTLTDRNATPNSAATSATQ